jgi:hypothetical protein
MGPARLPVLAALASFALAAWTPAAAQTVAETPGSGSRAAPPEEIGRNVLRLNLGGGLYAWTRNDYTSCLILYVIPATCGSSQEDRSVRFVVGPEVDLFLGGSSSLALGLTAAIGDVTTWSPSVDYLRAITPPSAETAFQFRVGAAGYFAPGAATGGAIRLGFGASFLPASRLGIGLSLVLEGGVMNDRFLAGLQLLASPDLRF